MPEYPADLGLLDPTAPYVTPFTGSAVTAVREPWLDIREKGAKVDGATDDSAAVLAAIQALPAYSGGAGGGTVFFPAGITQIDVSASLAAAITNGVTLRGAGPRSSVIRGTFAGPMLGTPGNGGADPLNVYVGLEELFLINNSANAAATAFTLTQVGGFKADRCMFQAAGGYNCRVVASNVVDFIDSKFGGAAGPQAGLFFDGAAQGNNNVLRVFGCDFADTKSGLRAVGGTALYVVANHFEALAGGASSYNASASIDAFSGGAVLSNYFESCVQSGIIFWATAGPNFGFDVGSNYLTNYGASPGIDASNLGYSNIMPNVFKPGALSVNPNGLVASGANAINNRISDQYLMSGSGAAITMSGSFQTRISGGQVVINTTSAGAWNGFILQKTGDANPFQMLTGLGMSTGPGGATAIDTFLRRGGAGYWEAPMLVKAGVPSDADYANAPHDGTTAINSSGAAGSRLYCRISGVWTAVA